MELILNDGSGGESLVKFKELTDASNNGSQCKVATKDGKELTVPSDYLHYVENPDIASIPQVSEDYCRECNNITKQDLAHILQPKSLSPLQEEIMSYHIKMHHIPFNQLIVLAEKGKIPRRLATLKGRTPICVACIFGTAHKRPWRN